MDLLEELCTTPGVPGREHRIRTLIEGHAKRLFDSIVTDTMGTLICTRKPRPAPARGKKRTTAKPPRIMLAAHMDQIGFLVSHVDDKGFIRLNPVGGFDTRNLFARLVTICPDVRDPKKDLPGVLNPGGKPVHIADQADKTKVPEIHEFFVDTGLPGEEVKKKVKIGDMVVLSARYSHVGNAIVSQCLDNRVACWLAVEAIGNLKHHEAEIIVAFTVQEEVGLRGARTSAYAIKPDIGIALDTTLCVDTPGVPGEMAITNQGKGVAITCMDSTSIADYDLLETFETIARKRRIPYQRSIMMRGGTDAGTIQASGAGVRTMTLSIPTRYIHTVTETVHKDDLEAAVKLLTAYLTEARA
ncbi:MAG: M20/M25/M40 family metallo-hydrolase [Phycisphaeraceae bacterium]|nr:M20/M25/M40 family metallo-hydrolase [Phycisphaeraceae bacterium]